jgi:hypothetical protein
MIKVHNKKGLKRYMYIKYMVSILLLFNLLSIVNSAHAIPAFARQQGVSCSTCHTAWPQLNAAGREFKELGYRFAEEVGEEKKFSELFEEGFPISGAIIARPFDKKDSGTKKVRALHEIELFAGGALSQNWSGFMEIEAEDETDFKPEIASGILSYHHNKAVNVQFSWGSYFSSDSYGFLGDNFRMTRGPVKAIDSAFGKADGGLGLRGTRQMVGLYGRPIKNLFYNVAYSGIASDTEGVDASNIHARIAYDVYDGVMLGAFSIRGDNATTNQNFVRNGIDFQADIGDARIQGLYVSAEDDITNGAAADNTALSLQGMYVFKNGKKPTWVPIMRYDSYEFLDGQEVYDELTFNLTYYFTQNVKGYVEYWKQLDVPDHLTEDSRLTLQLSLAY